jgi:hypothetical protein
MSMSTRESMRRELKELAKLAETMGKGSAESDAEIEAVPADMAGPFPGATLERPPTPASASRVSVPPIATPTAPPVFDYPEPKKPGKRTGIIAVIVGASLAAALVGGAAVGKSIAGAPAETKAAAATLATPPAEPAAPAPPPVQPAAADPVAVAPAASPQSAPVAAVAQPAPNKASTPMQAVALAHKRPVAAAKPVAAAAAPKPAGGNPPSTDSDGIPVSAPAKAAAAPAKPAKAGLASGGGESLEDLIRKEVAAQKK